MVGYWHGYLSGARCRLAYGPANATATHCLLHGYWVVPDKRPLNGCVCVCVSVVKFLVVLLLIVMLVFVSSVSLFYCSVHQMYAAGCIVLWACVHAGWMTGLSPSSSFFLLLHTHMQTLAWKPNSCLV